MSYAEDFAIDCGPPDYVMADYWVSKDGSVHYPQDMSISHIKNTIKHIENKGLQEWPIYELLVIEYNNRTGN